MRKFASKFAVVSLSFALAGAFAGCSGKPQLFEENAHTSLEVKPKTTVDATIVNDADHPIYVVATASRPAPPAAADSSPPAAPKKETKTQ